jgi:hypothetical protein
MALLDQLHFALSYNFQYTDHFTNLITKLVHHFERYLVQLTKPTKASELLKQQCYVRY